MSAKASFQAFLACCCTLILPLIALPSHASGQARVELIPFFTSYYPTGKTQEQTGGVEEKQENAPGFGLRASFAVTNSFALEAAGSYVKSGTRITDNDPDSPNTGTPFALGGNITTASLRVRFSARRSNLYFVAGPAMIRRGGETWDFEGLDELTSVGGVLGTGLRAQVTPRFGLDVLLEALVYSMDPDGDDNTFGYEKESQFDLLLSVGIPIGLAGR